ncbi:M91 family zinc metallopeptidase [Pseudoxanthomonas wuyuanensis]
MKRIPTRVLLLLAGWWLAGTSLAQTTVEYIHTDALGSVVAVTNAAGQVIERNDYEPYGAIIGKPSYGGVGFTGHVQDAVTGLTYMQQRYYDPGIGAFLSVDPVAVNTTTAWNFCRYCYGANSPYKFTDPDGRRIRIVGSDEFRKQVKEDIKVLRSKPEGKALVSALKSTRNTITIKESTGGNSTATSAQPSANGSTGIGSEIKYNPNSTTGGQDVNGSNQRPAFVGLAHEMGHADALDKGIQSNDYGIPIRGTTPPAENHSLPIENKIRSEHGLPERATYY